MFHPAPRRSLRPACSHLCRRYMRSAPWFYTSPRRSFGPSLKLRSRQVPSTSYRTLSKFVSELSIACAPPSCPLPYSSPVTQSLDHGRAGLLLIRVETGRMCLAFNRPESASRPVCRRLNPRERTKKTFGGAAEQSDFTASYAAGAEIARPRDSRFAPKVSKRIHSQACGGEEVGRQSEPDPIQTFLFRGLRTNSPRGEKNQEWNSLEGKTAELQNYPQTSKFERNA